MGVATSVIRPAAEPDLPFLIWTMRTAATSHLERCLWDVLLGLESNDTDAALSAAAVSARPHWCHLRRFWIAELNGQPAGALSAYDTTTEGSAVLEEALAATASILSLDDAALGSVLQRGGLLRDCTPADYPAAWGIENVAVVPEGRGTGIVDELLDQALRLGRDQGYDHAQILCLNGNLRAQRTWERQGFEVRADYRHQLFAETFGCPGMKMLVQRL